MMLKHKYVGEIDAEVTLRIHSTNKITHTWQTNTPTVPGVELVEDFWDIVFWEVELGAYDEATSKRVGENDVQEWINSNIRNPITYDPATRHITFATTKEAVAAKLQYPTIFAPVQSCPDQT